MPVASGFIEANTLEDVDRVISVLLQRGTEVHEVKGGKVVFLVEKETLAAVKAVLESLNALDGVRSVSLAYYSLDESDADTRPS
jgi:nitrate reductase NapAB chaperone NapD